jgi:UDP-2,4-diacetamido-2,4,6-trideoxy-beta-L-altropyranose hydrolase
MIWQMRTDESVRATSIDTRPITWEGHQSWLARLLVDTRGVLLLVRERGQPVGVQRFEMAEDSSDEALV